MAGAAVALVNDLPAMLLAVSRLMFAWAEDGIVPRVGRPGTPALPHAPRGHRPSGLVASLGILGSHLAGDFFLGVDILVTSMLVNFLLMCGSVLALPGRNPAIARDVPVLPRAAAQAPVAVAGTFSSGRSWRFTSRSDLSAPVSAWYFRSTPVWLGVMAVATAIYSREMRSSGGAGSTSRRPSPLLPPE